MTSRIGNKNVTRQRSEKEKKEIKQANMAQEAIKKADAVAKYHNTVEGQLSTKLA